MKEFGELSYMVIKGDFVRAKELTQKLIANGSSFMEIISKGLIDGMNKVKNKYEDGECYLTDVMMTAKAVTAGLEVLDEAEFPCLGKRVVQQESQHRIKNLVNMMVENTGLCKCCARNLLGS